MNSLQEEICKSSKTMLIITKVLLFLLVIGLCIPAAILILHAISPNTDFITIPGVSFYSSTGQLVKSTDGLMAEMCTILFTGIFISCIMYVFCSIFKTINMDAMPLSLENAKKLRKIAIILLIYSLAEPIARAGFYRCFAPEITMYTSINIISVVLALLFFFMSVVFNYGAELQRQSNETL